ncbi:UbiA family prenyltransferase [Devosia sp. YIM 151766]|uniref:UbiA family prenyltransferase n=1 Tax=Devosia sp. YIM 151766 TaxID=3017325 RepID=UPI00255D083A|nr:UbiA family prenyltransferase [Devosia sp. YIM 151766]WIY53944.1 UbiA family prenyltransferase [Devosia sp. YIM 151766]
MSTDSVTAIAIDSRMTEAAPLVLDVDGALLRTDLLHESAIAYVKINPLGLIFLVWWLIQGKAVLKRKLAERVRLDIEHLPINTELEAYARLAHDNGRTICLATAADELLAIKLAQRFDFISFVIASNGRRNLKGLAKAFALKEQFPNGFVYAGDSRSDLHVWTAATSIVLAGANSATSRQARALGKPVEADFPRPRLGLRGWVKALRLHQWAKNVLVFMPLVLGGLFTDLTAWTNAALAFLALGILASATYLVNDIWDIEDDRRHWTKRHRPLASGLMTVKQAVIVTPLAFVVSLALGAMVGPAVVAVLLAYLVLTLCYSFGFKRKPVLDAFTLASLFTLRLILGIAAVGVVASPWLLVFSMFLFTSLSFAKRQTEVLRLMEKKQDTGDKIFGRGYFVADAPFILAMGVSCGMASILIMVLYLTQDALLVDFYGNADWLWAIPAILFLWLSRIWMLCQRGELLDDPVVFAMRDPKSLMLCAGLGLFFAMACLGVPY